MNFSILAPVHEGKGYQSILYINQKSEPALKDSIALFAEYFKKEMSFDSLQFDNSMFNNSNYTGFVFLKRATDLVIHENHFPSRIVGAGVFFKEMDVFKLDWIWIHPFCRNRGLLKQHWKEFQDKFGNFTVSEPTSLHMSKFLIDHHSSKKILL